MARYQKMINAFKSLPIWYEKLRLGFDAHIHRYPKVYSKLRFYRDGVSGGDLFYTFAKNGPIIFQRHGLLTGLGIVSFIFWPVAIATIIGILLFAVSQFVDYRERRAKALQQKLDAENLDKKINSIETILKEGLNNNISLDIPNTNEELLQLVMQDYFSRLGLREDEDLEQMEERLNKKRNQGGRLPSQDSMIELLELVTGLKRQHPKFFAAVKPILGEHFAKQVFTAFKLKVDPETPPQNGNATRFSRIKNLIDYLDKTKLARVLKNSQKFVHRGNTAFVLAIGLGILSGLIAFTPAGAVIAPLWLLVGGGIFGLGSGAATIIVERYIEKKDKIKLKEDEAKFKANKIRYHLLYKLNKQQAPEYPNSEEKYEPSLTVETDKSFNSTPVPIGLRARIWVQTVTQALYGGSIGFLIGAGIAFAFSVVIGHLFPPVGIPLLMITLPALVVGSTYFARYGWKFGKGTYLAGKAEIARLQEVTELEKNYKERLGVGKVNDLLNKSKEELIVDLLDAYDAYYKRIKLTAPSPNDVLDKKEKLLLKLERATGIMRSCDEKNGMPNNRDDAFYEKLVEYLLKTKTTQENAVKKVTAFKRQILGDSNIENVKTAASSWLPSLKGIKQKGLKGNHGLIKYVWPPLIALSVGIPLGFVLFFTGGTALIPLLAIGITTGIVFGLFAVARKCELMGERHKAQLDEKEAKLHLIHGIVKTTKAAAKASLGQEAEQTTAVVDDHGVANGIKKEASPPIPIREVVEIPLEKRSSRRKFFSLMTNVKVKETTEFDSTKPKSEWSVGSLLRDNSKEKQEAYDRDNGNSKKPSLFPIQSSGGKSFAEMLSGSSTQSPISRPVTKNESIPVSSSAPPTLWNNSSVKIT